MRLEGKVAIVVGAGQTTGETVGNGRAASILFAREGARVLLVDRDLQSAELTRDMILEEGGVASAIEADITNEADCKRFADVCIERYSCVDILQNNVGIGTGDKGPASLESETWDNIMGVNLKGTFFSCKHVIPYMRKQGNGCITNISSGAAVMSVGLVGYKVSKAGVNSLTHTIAMGNAKYGIRANVVMPGLLDTPMAIESHSSARGVSLESLRSERDAHVPLRNKMGTAWDTAYASLFLASDEAQFITGAVLPVDGGQSARIG
ncbi:SDR family oxidoreductase [Pseudomaricurvus alkylphenolicus]|uniref:SDR family NAD(P)-dependent oxidoreductase n=1 Tax=Pseudomaricurvus alkylphenolicus TaxID=1306991 RepID=UPI00141F4AEF|nr:SDR family NAD(P)-dependent oxidoreductase [Pseudomaricurvus alkylphenolicus]NIB41467.1 SDR family oxidoreductase [Pseudomaricurvus alkylphenolicus]